jgi:hypothetical protein
VGEEERFGRATEIDERARTNQLSSERRNRFGIEHDELGFSNYNIFRSIWEGFGRKRLTGRNRDLGARVQQYDVYA